ncbi:MAG: UDP-N-acetylmuramoyl-tripeptide--D-alanyl-D-alanine ligase [Paramuribaculum sp.]|nr:UDP-N-acetylmuramoyl-tripeptide--D-alanyl-D-alanine ligase [Paramuribaculum sp.]
MVITILIYCMVLAFAGATMWSEFRRDLMMMQQNSYRIDRYRRWLSASGDSTSWLKLLGLCVLGASLATFSSPVWGMGITFVFSASSYGWLFTRRYKKPLVMTKRAWRILITATALALFTVLAAILLVKGNEISRIVAASFTCLGIYCASHIYMIVAVWLLEPVEKHINKGFYNEAKQILASMPRLKVIGITGSYGKTSTKHFLTRILSEKYEVLMTPGSFNTTMGVIRTVREHMKPYTEVFVCEMGAKQLNDIREICDLVHPEIGIVTAVGPQHLESFKSIENVQRTKFELVDSLPHDGLAVVNNDFPYIANRSVSNVQCVRYGVSNTDGSQYLVRNIKYDSSGTTFTIVGQGVEQMFHTRLLGECNVSNLLAAIIVALQLEVSMEQIARAVEHIEPVEHRLSVKRTPGGVTILDDAYNSNPSGSAMAMEVLGAMTNGKRIVVTPGMIELGERQYELNRELGVNIAKNVDVAIVVGEYNRDAIVEGIENAGIQPPKVVTVDSFAAAQQELAAMLQSGDTVLYENDLPDTFK